MKQVSSVLRFAVILLILAPASSAFGQNLTVGLLRNDPGSFDGYTLFAPSSTAYLIDMNGRLVHSWPAVGMNPGASAYLLEDGTLLRGARGRVELYDWGGTRLWQYVSTPGVHDLHHDVEPLPNGNVLMIAYETKSATEAIAAGRNPTLLADGELWPDHIIEVDPNLPPGSNIVWEWHVWDHLIQDYDSLRENFGVVADNPGRVDINASASPGAAASDDWMHTNGIDYNPDFDQIILSIHNLSEIWIIDHSTTTAEAADSSGGFYGKGGDLLYRWGNPAMYDAGNAADRTLWAQHDARWVLPGHPGQGNITIFNNGVNRPGGNASSVDEIVLPVDIDGHYALAVGQAYEPTAPIWSYMDPTPTDFYANFISGAHRLANGNTYITNGPIGSFFEVTTEGDVVWEYINPVTRFGDVVTQGEPIIESNQVFRSHRYAADHAGLDGRDLTPGDPIEPYPCTTPPAYLLLSKTAGDLQLSWTPACANRYLRSSLDPWAVDYAIPFADSSGTELDVPMPAETLVFWSIE